MDRRPPRKGKGRPKGGKPRPGRRAPPPAGTGEESRFLIGLKQAGRPLVLKLADGAEIEGTLAGIDRDQITLEGPDGSRVIRKRDIRYIYEAD